MNPYTFKNEQQPDIDAKAYLDELISYFNTDVLPEKTGSSTDMDTYGLNYILDEPLVYIDGVETAATDAYFIIINMQACNSANFALFSTFNDAGGQLEFLETQLAALRGTSKKAIVIGAGRAPGDGLCNRQWSYRFLTLIDNYQDVVRTIIIGGEKDGFQVLNGI